MIRFRIVRFLLNVEYALYEEIGQMAKKLKSRTEKHRLDIVKFKPQVNVPGIGKKKTKKIKGKRKKGRRR
jgi:hypothetical protein